MNNIVTGKCEQRLDAQFLKSDRCHRRVYICSSLSAGTEKAMIHNIHEARTYMLYAMEKMGMTASQIHLLQRIKEHIE